MAELVWSRIIEWVLKLFFFLFVIAVLFNIIKSITNSDAIDKNSPIIKTNDVSKHDGVSEKINDVQQKFTYEITQSLDVDKKCLLEYSGLNGLNDLKMELDNYDNKVYSSILNLAGKGYQQVNTINTKDKNINICIVKAENFYNCYLGDGRGCDDLFTDVKTIIVSKNDISVYETSYDYDKGILFKPQKNLVCFIPTHKYTGGSKWKVWQMVSRLGCDANEGTLDDDCIASIKDKVKSCNAASSNSGIAVAAVRG